MFRQRAIFLFSSFVNELLIYHFSVVYMFGQIVYYIKPSQLSSIFIYKFDVPFPFLKYSCILDYKLQNARYIDIYDKFEDTKGIIRNRKHIIMTF